MPWTRLDDGFAQHPKVVALSDGAFRLHVAGLTYAARHLTDGLVPRAALPTLYSKPTRPVTELVAAGLWHDPDHACPDCPTVPAGAFFLHDFLVYNPTAAETERRAAERTAKARRAARARWNRNSDPMLRASSEQSSEHMLADAPSRPVPPTNSSPLAPGKRSNEDERVEAILAYIARGAAERNGARNPTAYARRVREQLDRPDRPDATSARDRAASLVPLYRPDTPVDCLAAAVLGEPSGGLAFYRLAPDLQVLEGGA
jgi:hypothetical protein